MNDDQSLAQVEPSQRPSDYYAPVELPTPEQMKVRLVPSHLLTRLEETRSDENRWSNIAALFIGAALGFISDFAISGQKCSDLSLAAKVVLIVFVIGIAFAAMEYRRYRNRAEFAWKEMMEIGSESKPQLSTVEPISDEGEIV